ncbi:hypothetical protein TNCV_961651 [Trichonephila clavipes]|nr:hypothetical protein TNCV_961651 [Trichonephila clavipes]
MLPVLGKKAVLEWCMEEGLIGSSYVCQEMWKKYGKERTVSPTPWRRIFDPRQKGRCKARFFQTRTDDVQKTENVDNHKKKQLKLNSSAKKTKIEKIGKTYVLTKERLFSPWEGTMW